MIANSYGHKHAFQSSDSSSEKRLQVRRPHPRSVTDGPPLMRRRLFYLLSVVLFNLQQDRSNLVQNEFFISALPVEPLDSFGDEVNFVGRLRTIQLHQDALCRNGSHVREKCCLAPPKVRVRRVLSDRTSSPSRSSHAFPLAWSSHSNSRLC